MVVTMLGVVDMASNMANILERIESVFLRSGNIGELDGC